MNTIAVTAGLACIICAAIGGGFRGFGMEFPLLQSVWRQVLLGVLGMTILLVAAIAALPSPGPSPAPTPTPSSAPTPTPSASPSVAAAVAAVPTAVATPKTVRSVHADADHAADASWTAPNANLVALLNQIEGADNRIRIACDVDHNDQDCARDRDRRRATMHLLQTVVAGVTGKCPDDPPQSFDAVRRDDQWLARCSPPSGPRYRINAKTGAMRRS